MPKMPPRELDRRVPKAEELVGEMRSLVTLRAVTFQERKGAMLQMRVRRECANVALAKPFCEYFAAPLAAQLGLHGLTP